MSWSDRLRPSDWRKACTQMCGRSVTKCPECGHPSHQGLWVDLPTNDHVVVVARHAHFLRPSLIDPARNWSHRIRKEKVDPRVFEMKRVIAHREHLPEDIRRIFDER
jgi:hypothetical protein